MSEVLQSDKYFYIDTHAHLDMLKGITAEFAVSESLRENVRYIINVGSSISGSRKSSEYSRQFENVYASAGIHPHYVRNFEDKYIDTLENLIRENEKIVAVGETGFDYFRNLSPKVDQQKAFTKHIELAQKYKLPLIVHDRDAHGDIFEVLKYYYRGIKNSDKPDTGPSAKSGYSTGISNAVIGRSASFGGSERKKVVIHCFSGDTGFALKCIEEGFYISFTGVITYPNAKLLQQTVKEVPLERIFIETDSPFLAPQEKRGSENYPGYVIYIAKKISEIKNISLTEVARITSENALGFFNISF
jgi:TatD DNase family protein